MRLVPPTSLEHLLSPGRPGGVIVLALAGAMLLAVACGGEQQASPATSSASATDTTSTPAGRAVVVETGDSFFQGPLVKGGGVTGQEVTIDLPVGKTAFQVANNGALPHNFHVTGGVEALIELIPAGQEKSIDIDLPAGEYRLVCDFHPNDMFGRLIVR